MILKSCGSCVLKGLCHFENSTEVTYSLLSKRRRLSFQVGVVQNLLRCQRRIVRQDPPSGEKSTERVPSYGRKGVWPFCRIPYPQNFDVRAVFHSTQTGRPPSPTIFHWDKITILKRLVVPQNRGGAAALPSPVRGIDKVSVPSV